VQITVSGAFLVNQSTFPAGAYELVAKPEGIVLNVPLGREKICVKSLTLAPLPEEHTLFHIDNMLIGRSFHWERAQQQTFQGELVIEQEEDATLRVINVVPLEQYLQSVISSEMSSASPVEFLKAHCIVSRSWLLAQLRKKAKHAYLYGTPDKRWTDATEHRFFDVCNDDHCQRYHGISRVNTAVQEALAATRGQVLLYGDEICDARFSKCCGGITETYATAWEDIMVPYLMPIADSPQHPRAYLPPLRDETVVECFIRTRPPAYCNVADRTLLAQLLPDFDCETHHFFRWKVTLSQDELQELLLLKTGIDFGEISSLVPCARGASGRISALKVCGTKAEKVFGKELEIRRILSRTHLYSSAFVVKPTDLREAIPHRFTLVGAGWGHGVGMCQIGAAALAAAGKDCHAILHHYFTGVSIQKIYT